MRAIRSLALSLFLAALATSPLLAQDAADGARITDGAALEAAVTSHERAADRTRAELLGVLDRDDVHDVAAKRGIDMERVRGKAMTLSDGALAALASQVSEAAAIPQDRITISISAVTIIIILLLLILLT